jgi:hypothetical protein
MVDEAPVAGVAGGHGRVILRHQSDRGQGDIRQRLQGGPGEHQGPAAFKLSEKRFSSDALAPQETGQGRAEMAAGGAKGKGEALRTGTGEGGKGRWGNPARCVLAIFTERVPEN